jgi:2-hydroxychromene-2-carboxylate isomerase
MSGALKPQPFDEIAAQHALADQFQKLELEFSSLHPTIRTVMERAVIATGNVRQEVERFILVARMADQQDLSDEEKRHVLEKAYERYGQNTGLLESARSAGRSG